MEGAVPCDCFTVNLVSPDGSSCLLQDGDRCVGMRNAETEQREQRTGERPTRGDGGQRRYRRRGHLLVKPTPITAETEREGVLLFSSPLSSPLRGGGGVDGNGRRSFSAHSNAAAEIYFCARHSHLHTSLALWHVSWRRVNTIAHYLPAAAVGARAICWSAAARGPTFIMLIAAMF